MSEAVSPYLPPESQLASDEKKCDSCNNIIKVKAEICPGCGVRQRKPVSKVALLLLTFFFGGIGVHKFYLGKNWQGVLYLIFFWTYIPGIIALIEFIIYVFTSSDRLNEKYSAEGSAVAVVLVIVGFFFIIGILAAIAIPAYQDYIIRAKLSETQIASKSAMEAVEAYAIQERKWPKNIAAININPEPASRYISSIKIDRGVIYMNVSPESGATGSIVYVPTANNSEITWSCKESTVPVKFLPKQCRP